MATEKQLPELDDLFKAADAHGEANCDSDYATGDLQEMLRAAWRVMTPEQRLAFYAQDELIALADIDEYEPLIKHLIPQE